MLLLLGHAGLAATIFLLALHGLRPGERRSYLDALLAGVLLLLLGGIWMGYGPGTAATAAGVSLLYAAVLLPLAAPTARALFGPEPPESWQGPPPPSPELRRISEGVVRGEPGAVAAMLDRCEASAAVAEVMRRRGATRAGLEMLLTRLLAAGGDRWVGEHLVAASAVADPAALDWLLARGDPGRHEVDALADYLGWAAPLR